MKIHHTQLCRFLVDTVVGQVLMAVPKQDSEELFVRYLHDFIRYVHVCGRHNNIELNELEFKVCKQNYYIIAIIIIIFFLITFYAHFFV